MTDAPIGVAVGVMAERVLLKVRISKQSGWTLEMTSDQAADLRDRIDIAIDAVDSGHGTADSFEEFMDTSL